MRSRQAGTSSGSLRIRGLIEGFYGPPYSFEARLDLVRFLPKAGLDTYLYAPKLDVYHRERWREPYPAEFLEHFSSLAETARATGVRFVYALSPALSFAPERGDTARVHEKLQTLHAAGVHDFCLLFDDITPDGAGADPRVQADLVIDTRAFLREQSANTSLCFISHLYAGTAQQFRSGTSPFQAMFPIPSAETYRAYERIPDDVPVLWTGPAVFTDRLTVAEAADFRRFVARPVLLWDNYPVNDAMPDELFLGPYVGREAGLGRSLDGILLNTMREPEASKIALWTAGRCFALEDRYDPRTAFEEALEAVGGTSNRSVTTLAEQFYGHPLIGDGRESVRLAALVDDFFRERSEATRAALRECFEGFARNARELGETLGSVALLNELRPAAQKLSLLGEAGLVGLDLLTQKRTRRPLALDRLEKLLAAAGEIRWRVGANTPLGTDFARLIGERPANDADVFGDFFARLRAQLASEAN